MDERTCQQCEITFTPTHGMQRFCEAHRGDQASRERELVQRVCVTCATPWMTKRRDAKYCSELCYHFDKWGARTCEWPRPAPKPRRVAKARPRPQPFDPHRECAWCGVAFTARIRTQVFCSRAHKVKVVRNKRRGREHGSPSHFTWSEFMKVYAKLDRCCAYCAQPIVGQPDPDHVVPLSRGGSNSITNILPSCRPCNSDKRDLLLHEWSEDRARRGLPERTTDPLHDPRWHHLTDALLRAA